VGPLIIPFVHRNACGRVVFYGQLADARPEYCAQRLERRLLRPQFYLLASAAFAASFTATAAAARHASHGKHRTVAAKLLFAQYPCFLTGKQKLLKQSRHARNLSAPL